MDRIYYANEKFWLRFFAWNVDSMILFIPIGIVSLYFDTDSSSSDIQTSIISFIAKFLAVYLYYVLTEGSPLKSSLGKLVFKIKIEQGLYPWNEAFLRNLYKMPFLIWFFSGYFYLSCISFVSFLGCCIYFIVKDEAIYDYYSHVELVYQKQYNLNSIFRWLVGGSLALILLSGLLLNTLSGAGSTISLNLIIGVFLVSGIATHIYGFYKPTYLHAQLLLALPYLLLIVLIVIGLKDTVPNSSQFAELKQMLTTSGMLNNNQDITSLLTPH